MKPIPAMLCTRETAGTRISRIGVITMKLEELYNRESMFDHPMIHHVYCRLVELCRQSDTTAAVEKMLCRVDMTETSIVILGTDVANSINDEELLLMCDEVKMCTL